MILLADENIRFDLIESVRAAGFEVISILESCPGVTDEEVLNFASQKCAVLLTNDKDFGNMVYRLKIPNHGIILLRTPELASIEVFKILIEVLENKTVDLHDSFTVITDQAVRIRKLTGS